MGMGRGGDLPLFLTFLICFFLFFGENGDGKGGTAVKIFFL